MSGPTAEQLAQLRQLPGLIASVNLTGTVMPQYAAALSDMRSYNDRNGFHKVEYKDFYAVLVESGRDSAVTHMLKEGYAWLLQIDADAAPFQPDALTRMLYCAFVAMPHIDALGGYCQVKQWPHWPTIDTGTGTWEEHYPGEGVIPVIRTGCHFILTKRSVFKGTGPPWFRTRLAITPARAMMEVDNYARRTLGGTNPFEYDPEWDTMWHAAYTEQGMGESHVGEDSSFFDKAAAAGHKIYVDTDLIVGHVTSKSIMPTDFIEAMQLRKRQMAACVGVTI